MNENSPYASHRARLAMATIPTELDQRIEFCADRGLQGAISDTMKSAGVVSIDALKALDGDDRDKATEYLGDAIIRDWQGPDSLEISYVRTYTILLTMGGPSVYYELQWNPSLGCWVGGRFIHSDCEPTECELPAEEVDQVAEAYGIFPDDES